MGRAIVKYSCLLLISSLLYPQSMINRFRVPIHINLQSGIGHDSNFLKLSDQEANEVSFYPALLGDSKSSSSLIITNSLSVKYSPFIWKNHESQIRFKINVNKYIESSDKSYSSFGYYFAQHFGKYEWLKLSYLYLPQYYLRDYRDRDNIIMNVNSDGILEECYFSQGSTTLSYSKWLRLKRTWIEGILNYKTQYYNPTFTEFDLNISSVGIKFYSNYNKKYSMQIHLIQSFADNITFQSGLKSTENINRGYTQKDILIRFERKNISSIIFQHFGFLYSITSRDYSSDIELDLLHYNRSHTEKKINLWLRGELNFSTDYRLDIRYRHRNSISDSEWVEDLKGFEKIEYYFTLSYSFSSDILY